MASNAPASDAGSLRRGALLLKILATAGTRGLTLTQLAAAAELPHPSVHRVLQQLVAERLASRNDNLRRYRLGPLIYELGMAGASMYDLRELCDGHMHAAVGRDHGHRVPRRSQRLLSGLHAPHRGLVPDPHAGA